MVEQKLPESRGLIMITPTEITSMADPARLAYCGRKPGTKPSEKQPVYPDWLVTGSACLGGLYSGQEPIESGVLITKMRNRYGLVSHAVSIS
jgi:hypothetical protein